MIPRVSHFRTTHIGVQQTVDRLRRAVNVAIVAQDVGKTTSSEASRNRWSWSSRSRLDAADTTLGYLLDKGNEQLRIDATTLAAVGGSGITPEGGLFFTAIDLRRGMIRACVFSSHPSRTWASRWRSIGSHGPSKVLLARSPS